MDREAERLEANAAPDEGASGNSLEHTLTDNEVSFSLLSLSN